MADSRNEVRIPPRQPLVPLSELDILVRVPGHPEKIRAYAAWQSDEAAQYAAENGGECVPLPVTDGVWDWDAGCMRQPEPPAEGR